MTDEQLNDLKQLIVTTVKQSVDSSIAEVERRIGGRFDGLERRFDKLEHEVAELRHEMHDGFNSIAEILDPNNDQLEDHERRITKLEQQAA